MRLTSLVAAAAVLGGLAWGDTVTLKSGTKLDGEVLQEGEVLRLSTGIAILPIRKDDVQTLEVNKADRELYAQKAATLEAGNAAGHFELAQWCKSRHLYTLMRKELEATAKADSGHKQAAEFLKRTDGNGCVLATDANGKPRGAIVRPRSPEDLTDEAKKLGVAPEALYKARMKWIADEEAKDLFIANLVGEIGSLHKGSGETAARAKEHIVKLGERACPFLASLADFRQVGDSDTRAAAMKGIEALHLKSGEISATLASAAMADPDETRRKQACKTIKIIDDVGALAYLMQYAMTPEWGAVDAAVAALKEINDARVSRGLFYYVCIEMRPTLTELVSFQTRQIDAFNVMSGANTNLVTLLSFPIQFPELRVSRVRTMVKLPAMNALVALSGQDYGENLGKWKEWVDRQ